MVPIGVRFPLRALHIFGVTSLAFPLRTRSGYPRKYYEISREFTE
jgi:predicted transcriptional regulator